MDASLLIGTVSACTALVASIVGPIVALNVAKRQFSATAIAGNRHKWIETLHSDDALDAETEADIQTVVVLAQSILKREWQRVKLGT